MEVTLKLSYAIKWLKEKISAMVRHDAFIIVSILVIMFSILGIGIHYDTATITDEQYIELNQLLEEQPYLKYMVVDCLNEDGEMLVKNFKKIKNKAKLPLIYSGEVPEEADND